MYMFILNIFFLLFLNTMFKKKSFLFLRFFIFRNVTIYFSIGVFNFIVMILIDFFGNYDNVEFILVSI